MRGSELAVLPATAARRLPELRLTRAHAFLAAEVAAFVSIFAVAIVIRLWRLGSIPRVIMGDESDNVQVAYKIIAGTGPGIFGFDWKPAPIFSMYPLAWTIQVFGDSVSDFRMFPVILSLLVLIAFYAVARESMGAPAALLAFGLLATNLWFLHFSRTAWENSNAALFALGACWAVTRAVKTGSQWFWAIAGVFTAFGLYGYFAGRFIFLSVGVIAFLAIALRLAPWRRTLIGLAIAAGVCTVLFAPMAYNIARDWDFFNTRTTNASIFHEVPGAQEFPQDETGWRVAWHNVKQNYEGLILLDGDAMGVGLWQRYTPPGRAPLGFIASHLFWAGLVVGAVLRRRDTYAWWPFFVPLAIAQIFSRGTPDLARAMIFAPFYFLFIGIALDEGIRRLRTVPRQAIAIAAAAIVVAAIGISDVNRYFDWQRQTGTQASRFPGIEVCEWNDWRAIAKEAASKGAIVSGEQVAEMRTQNACSTIAAGERFQER
jgi:4-amino-4-deoxy-L-arabinose transferase-like glycosyltransferase